LGDDKALFREACRIGLAYSMDPDTILDTKRLWQFIEMGQIALEHRRESMKDRLTIYHTSDPKGLRDSLTEKEEVDPLDQWTKLYEATGDHRKVQKIRNQKMARKLMQEEQENGGRKRR